MHPRSAPSLDGAEAWLLRADEHLYELELVILPLLKIEREAMIASLKVNSDTEPGIMASFGFTQPTEPVPTRVSILFGEAIQALRRSLDYLIFELAWLDSGSQQGGTQFPLESSDLVFWRRLERVEGSGPATFLRGVKGEHAAVIERYQPYHGTHWAKSLRTLSNPDKHRHLTITRSKHQEGLTAQRPMKEPAPIKRRYNGFTAIWPVSNDVQVKLEIAIYISLDDGTRVVDALNEVMHGVNYALLEFRPCFEGKCPH